MFETARSIVQGISAVIAAKATAYPSISSSTALGSAARRDRAWSSDSDARATESASPSSPVERGLVAVGEPQLGRRLVADADAVAAHQPGGQHRADRGQVGVVAPGHPGQHHPLRPVPGDRVHRAHAGPGQAEPAQLQRRVPERQPPRLELGRDEHERDGRPAHTISTIRSIAPRARAATSSGTVTGYCISRRLSRSLGRVICFM